MVIAIEKNLGKVSTLQWSTVRKWLGTNAKKALCLKVSVDALSPTLCVECYQSAASVEATETLVVEYK